MDKHLKYLMLLLVTTLSLTLTACGGDDDEPYNPNGGSSATKYKIQTFTIDNGGCISPYFVDDDENNLKFCDVNTKCDSNTDYNEIIGFSYDHYGQASNIRMARYKNASSLSQITSLSGLCWIDSQIGDNGLCVNVDCFNLEEKTGFILEGSYSGRTYYIRLYISGFNRNSADEIIGVNGSWQQFQPK